VPVKWFVDFNLEGSQRSSCPHPSGQLCGDLRLAIWKLPWAASRGCGVPKVLSQRHAGCLDWSTWPSARQLQAPPRSIKQRQDHRSGSSAVVKFHLQLRGLRCCPVWQCSVVFCVAAQLIYRGSFQVYMPVPAPGSQLPVRWVPSCSGFRRLDLSTRTRR